ncbi:MAG: hypothetical protein Q6L68_07515, partial [Thermostichus sp. DG02_5_bins_236]
PDLPIQRVQGGVVAEVLKALQPQDLLVLIPSESRSRSRLGREPEIIARNQPTLSMIVIHLPRDPDHRLATEQTWY